jgi:hypothetical protein
MSYEVYNLYRRKPGYLEFINEVNRVVNHMRELKNWYNNLYMMSYLNDNAHMKYLELRQTELNKIYGLERKYGFYSDAPFTLGYY